VVLGKHLTGRDDGFPPCRREIDGVTSLMVEGERTVIHIEIVLRHVFSLFRRGGSPELSALAPREQMPAMYVNVQKGEVVRTNM
jgi:hypothetical protein